jgi:hypothetical protein
MATRTCACLGDALAATVALAGCTHPSGATRADVDGGAENPAVLAVGGSDAEGGGDGADTDEACPPSPGATTLCLSFRPEVVAPEAEPGLDHNGFLSVQVFDTPVPPGGDTGARVARYDRTFPGDAAAGAELALESLPTPVIAIEDAPAVVYVRALFFDNAGSPSADGSSGMTWGTWLGGMDLSRGFVEDPSLTAVPLAVGDVTRHEVPLTAMRRLTVTATTSRAPVGDGQGALSIVASRVEGLPPDVPTAGYGIDPCVDVTRGPQTVDVLVIGSGRFFVTGFFDDLGIETTGQMPPGTMLSTRASDAGQSLYDQVTLAPDQYAAQLTIDLGVISDPADVPADPGPNSCADLGLPGAP